MREYYLLASLAAASPQPASAAVASVPATQPAVVVADLHPAATAPAGPWDDAKLGPAATPAPSGPWDYAAVDPRTGALLVARMNGVQRFSVPSKAAASSLLAPGHRVHAIVPLPGDRLLFTDGDDATAAVVDARTGRAIGQVQTGAKPDGALYDPASRQVLVMDGSDGTVDRIDIASRIPRPAGRIRIGGKLEAPALGADGRLFVNVEDRNALAIVSLRDDGRLVDQVKLSDCEEPSGLALDRRSGLLVSACANGVAKVLDQTGQEVATLPIGTHPDAVIPDPDRSRVFIPCGGDGTLHEIVLDGVPRVSRVWSTRRGARTGAFDPRTNRVFLPYGDVNRPDNGPPRLVPGTFGVLVVDVR